MKWEMMGVPVEAQITGIATVVNRFHDAEKAGSPEHIVEVSLSDGRTLALGPVDLLSKFIDAAPKVGDLIKVAWTGNEKVAAGTRKVFTLNVIPSI